jgi:hypothetical protein
VTTLRHEYSPPWAPHIAGYYYEREVDEDGIPLEAEVGATCGTCGAVFKRMCSSGLMRHWICTFARVHLHRDPLNSEAPPRK